MNFKKQGLPISFYIEIYIFRKLIDEKIIQKLIKDQNSGGLYNIFRNDQRLTNFYPNLLSSKTAKAGDYH